MILQVEWVADILKAAAKANPRTAAIVVAGMLVALFMILYFKSQTISQLLTRLNTLGKILIITLLSLAFLVFSIIAGEKTLNFAIGVVAAMLFARFGVRELSKQVEEIVQ